jgi:hypothetical protein
MLLSLIGDFKGNFVFENLESIPSTFAGKMNKVISGKLMDLSIVRLAKEISCVVNRKVIKNTAVTRLFLQDLITLFNVEDFTIYAKVLGVTAKAELKAPGLARIIGIDIADLAVMGRDYGLENRRMDEEAPEFIKRSKVPSYF